ncbi:esterase-like activity of phytase family protein [Rhizobium tubonense]|uniref:Phytase-like domain-containing protein n=1 Tax=Rhizobium tubonense TaxID=484088 RepID=A0A2W4CE50_9HYPH|nr:esterase-like activity of phytase family protein [Rhizobium tubonense]PZM09498.1 hypothetical protein CPY51_24720 [Rhizobium tubonense]
MKRLCRVSMLAVLLTGCVSAGGPTAGGAAAMRATQISTFRFGSDQTKFGDLEFLGGLRLSSGNDLFGAASAIRFRPDHQHFVSVLDTGHWWTGAIERGDDGRLKGISDATITPMIDRFGMTHEGKGAMDAEGLALRGDSVLVSYEQDHRVDIYPDPGFETASPTGSIPILMRRSELRGNQSLEALMIAPAGSPLAGAAVLVTERSLDRDGNMLAAVLDGPRKGRFTVRHYDDFDVSDGVFLPDGDLLLMERRFDLAHGIGMRLRRIAGGDIKPGALVDGKVIFEANADDQIDNMEGIDAFRAEDGTIHVIMVSDDNHSILQRSLMLEFRLKD